LERQSHRITRSIRRAAALTPFVTQDSVYHCPFWYHFGRIDVIAHRHIALERHSLYYFSSQGAPITLVCLQALK
jgi:hypothetical protein